MASLWRQCTGETPIANMVLSNLNEMLSTSLPPPSMQCRVHYSDRAFFERQKVLKHTTTVDLLRVDIRVESLIDVYQRCYRSAWYVKDWASKSVIRLCIVNMSFVRVLDYAKPNTQQTKKGGSYLVPMYVWHVCFVYTSCQQIQILLLESNAHYDFHPDPFSYSYSQITAGIRSWKNYDYGSRRTNDPGLQ